MSFIGVVTFSCNSVEDGVPILDFEFLSGKEEYIISDRVHCGISSFFGRGWIVSRDAFPRRYVLHLCTSSA